MLRCSSWESCVPAMEVSQGLSCKRISVSALSMNSTSAALRGRRRSARGASPCGSGRERLVDLGANGRIALDRRAAEHLGHPGMFEFGRTARGRGGCFEGVAPVERVQDLLHRALVGPVTPEFALEPSFSNMMSASRIGVLEVPSSEVRELSYSRVSILISPEMIRRRKVS